MSINAKLLASGMILGILGVSFSVAVYQGNHAASDSAVAVFEKGVDPLERLERAAEKSSLLERRFLSKPALADPGGAIGKADGAELLTGLADILSDLRAAAVPLDPGTTASRLGELVYGLNRLRNAEGDVTPRLVRRELSTLVDEFDTAVNTLRQDILDLRAQSAGHSLGVERLVMLGCVLGLLVGCLLMAYLSRSIARSIRHAASSLLEVGGSAPSVAELPNRDVLRELGAAIRFVEATIAEKAEEASRQSRETVRRFEGELTRQRRDFDAALNTMSQAFCLLDEAGNLMAANEAFFRLFPDLNAGARSEVLARNDDLSALLQGDEDLHSRQLADGRCFDVRRHKSPRDGRTIIIFDDVTEQRTVSSKLERLSGEDGLTGLPNRARFYERLTQVLQDTETSADIAVLAIDIQGFNGVNTTLGHLAGDEILRQFAARLQSLIGPEDLLARLDGDEFGIVQMLQGQPGAGEKLCAAIAGDFADRPVMLGGRPVTLRVAIGMVPLTKTERASPLDAYSVMQDCEIALRNAKADPAEPFKIYVPEIREGLQARDRLIADLRNALDRKEFELHFQPIVNLKRQAVSGFEALVRWNHPKRGQISPGVFIPIMEETGLIVPLGRLVLEEACRHAARWPSNLSLSVNLSPLQFKSPNLVPDVRKALVSSGLAAERLQLEVTESLFLDDAESVLTMLSELRGLGLIVSMDDFGTGYSSLGYLSRFPFDKIKIDQSFVRDMRRAENLAIVRAVMGLGAAMKMTVIAEGVETVEQMATLEGEGCVEMQGFLFSKPRPSSDLAKILVEIRNGFSEGRYRQVSAANDSRAAR